MMLLKQRKDINNHWNLLFAVNGQCKFMDLGDEPEIQAEKYIPKIKYCLDWYDKDYKVLVSNMLHNGFNTEYLFYSDDLATNKEQVLQAIDFISNKPSKLNKKRLISVGRLSKEKGYMDLLEIFNKLHNIYPDWTLDIVGDGPEKDNLNKYINDNNLGDFVTLHGFQKKDYIDKLLHEASIYLMTSFTESFGIVLIEAMSHGLPCVAFNSAEGANELINSGENGYLIKNRNHDAYIKKVADLIEDKKTRKRIGKAGFEVSKKYESKVVGEKWFQLLGKKR